MKRKKRRYWLTERAAQDIAEIEAYIAQHNPPAAERLVHRIFKACDLLADNPGLGHSRTDLTSQSVRFWMVRPRFFIIYEDKTEPIVIVRVSPTDRDIANNILST